MKITESSDETVERLFDEALIPSVFRAYEDAQDLVAELEDYCSKPRTDMSQRDVKEAWRASRTSYKRTEAYQVESLDHLRVSLEVDAWPTKPAHIEAFLATDEDIEKELSKPRSLHMKGYPALEYVLFAEASMAHEETSKRERRCAYALALGRAIETHVWALVLALSPEGDVPPVLYKDGHAMLLRRMIFVVQHVIHYRLLLMHNVLPESGRIYLESPYAPHTLEDLRHTFGGFQDVWGEKESGLGAIVRRQNSELANAVDAHFVSIQKRLDTISVPILVQLEQGNVQELEALKQDVYALRGSLVEVATLLQVTLTYTHEDD